MRRKTSSLQDYVQRYYGDDGFRSNQIKTGLLRDISDRKTVGGNPKPNSKTSTRAQRALDYRQRKTNRKRVKRRIKIVNQLNNSKKKRKRTRKR